ncbi:MAG: hypothetical protein M1826_003843 [Phylliscum demangeonii]|nr:MAG: hypothetical protein M1826_003843 [Phylliscum demangeonii]
MCNAKLRNFTCGHTQKGAITKRCKYYEPVTKTCGNGLQARLGTREVYKFQRCRECQLMRFDQEAAVDLDAICRAAEVAVDVRNRQAFDELMDLYERTKRDSQAERRRMTSRCWLLQFCSGTCSVM